MRRLLLASALFVAACGQTGDLVLPDKAAKRPAPAATTPSPPPTPTPEDEKSSETPAVTTPPATP